MGRHACGPWEHSAWCELQVFIDALCWSEEVFCVPSVLSLYQESMLDFVKCSFVFTKVLVMFAFFSLFVW